MPDKAIRGLKIDIKTREDYKYAISTNKLLLSKMSKIVQDQKLDLEQPQTRMFIDFARFNVQDVQDVSLYFIFYIINFFF